MSQIATSNGRGGEADGAGPEILLQVHPGLCQLGPGLDLRQQRTREHQRLADPVGFVDDAQTVGVAVGDEDAEGERGQFQTLTLARTTALLRFAGADEGNAVGATSSGLWLAKSWKFSEGNKRGPWAERLVMVLTISKLATVW